MVTETVKEKYEFEFEEVEDEALPKTTYTKGSMYDPIVEAFLASPKTMVALKPKPDETANYLRTQIVKRIEAKKLKAEIKASVVNNKVYLQKIVKPNVEAQTEVKV